MRDTIFRGKRLDNDEWIEGNLIILASGDVAIMSTKIFDLTYIIADIVNPSTVGQYVGLSDKNGKKIFEGDIFRGAWGRCCSVVFDGDYLQFRAINSDGRTLPLDYYDLKQIEIIGNIYDDQDSVRMKGERLLCVT